MKKIQNYESVVVYDYRPLPAGFYKIKIDGAREEERQDGSRLLIIKFDIVEGEFAGYYTDLYNQSQEEDRKYKGVIRLYIPSEQLATAVL